MKFLSGSGETLDPELRALKRTMPEHRQRYAQLIVEQAQVKQQISRAGNDEATVIELKKKLHTLEQEQENAKGPLLEIETQVARFNRK